MPNQLETVYFGGGCFWCVEAVYQRIKGVELVTSGYAGGGSNDRPSYFRHGNHAETIKVDFDPTIISLEKLLEIFWNVHDPTTLNRQGYDTGTEYRSVILYSSESQKQVIENSIESVAKQLWDKPITTEVKPLDAFTEAENFHQNFYNQNRSNPYCQIIINPKLAKFEQKFADLIK